MLERQEGNEESEATRQRLPGDKTPESRRKFVIQVTNLRIFVFQVKILSMSVAISVQVKRREATRQHLPGDNTPEICHSSTKSQDFCLSSKKILACL